VWFLKTPRLPSGSCPAPGIAQRLSELLDEECAKQTLGIVLLRTDRHIPAY
jgi:hypothetical protein